MHPIFVLWAVPRSISTAFDRSMRERGDLTVFTEPFSAAYYFGGQRISRRFRGRPAEAGQDVDAVRRRLLAAAQDGPVFVKDMATHVEPWLDRDLVAPFTSTFLVRDPRLAIPSLWERWPDLDEAEAGYAPQRRLFDMIAAMSGEPPVVVDGEDLRRDAEGVLRAWCDAVGLPFVPAQLTWEPRDIPDWHRWGGWFDSARESTGFRPPDDDRDRHPALNVPRIAEIVERALVHYRALADHRIRPALSTDCVRHDDVRATDEGAP